MMMSAKKYLIPDPAKEWSFNQAEREFIVVNFDKLPIDFQSLFENVGIRNGDDMPTAALPLQP